MAIEGAALQNYCSRRFPRHRSTFRRRVPRRGRAARSSTTTPSSCSTAMATSARPPAAPDGLFHRDTRFLSRLELLLNGVQPLLLGSNVRDDNTLADRRSDQSGHVCRRITWCCRRTPCMSCAPSSCGAIPPISDWRSATTATAQSICASRCCFDSDFADLFEVRGLRRGQRGIVGRLAISTRASPF